jgi:hypothetical protein
MLLIHTNITVRMQQEEVLRQLTVGGQYKREKITAKFRQPYIRQSNDRLERLRKDIDRLGALCEAGKDSARSEWKDSINTLKDKEGLVRSRLDEMAYAGYPRG